MSANQDNVDDITGEIIEPGDTVIELIDGEPFIYTQPDAPWKFAGLIMLDDDNLRFPDVSRRPGIYRVTVYYEAKQPARYVGQAKSSLRRRFRGYRSRGRNPAVPPGTTTLLAQKYLAALRDRVTIGVEIIDDPEMSNAVVRDGLERRYIAEIDETKFEVLNRAHRPGHCPDA